MVLRVGENQRYDKVWKKIYLVVTPRTFFGIGVRESSMITLHLKLKKSLHFIQLKLHEHLFR